MLPYGTGPSKAHPSGSRPRRVTPADMRKLLGAPTRRREPSRSVDEVNTGALYRLAKGLANEGRGIKFCHSRLQRAGAVSVNQHLPSFPQAHVPTDQNGDPVRARWLRRAAITRTTRSLTQAPDPKALLRQIAAIWRPHPSRQRWQRR